MHQYRFKSGFTLVELVIVLSVISVLMLAGSSLTNSWVSGVQVNNAASAFKNAVYQARIAALRNSGNKSTNVPAASVCIDNGNIKVVAIANNETSLVCESAYNRPIQKISIADGVSITQNGTAVDCMTFSPAGLVLSFAGCSNNVSVQVEVEKDGEKVELDVI